MAKIIDNPKGFKIIEVSAEETFTWGGSGICDFCNGFFRMGFYIAVLNSCYCKECYDTWNTRNTYYPEDDYFEEQAFNQYKEFLGL